MATQSIRGAPYLPVVLEEGSPADERNRIAHVDLLTNATRRSPVHRPDFFPPELPWMISGEVYASVHTTVAQIDDGKRIEFPLEDEPVQAERPHRIGAEWKEGRGRGEGRKKEDPQKWENLPLKSKVEKKGHPINTPNAKRRPLGYRSNRVKRLARERSKRCRAKQAESTAIDEKNTPLSLLQYEGIKSSRTDEDIYPDLLLDIIISFGAFPSAGGARAPIAGVCTAGS